MTNTTTNLTDPRSFVREYIEINGIEVDERGILKGKEGKKNEEIFDTLYLDYMGIVNAHNSLQKTVIPALRTTVNIVQEKIMQKALLELITNRKIEYRSQVIQSVKCTKPSEVLLRKFIQALTGNIDEADVAVIAHWMWSVKVKMAGKNPTYHIMPILFGKQEGGKTVALNRLIGPINNFRLNITMNDMADGRYFKSMSENFVIVFDEMQGAQRTDIDALKKQVTIDENDYRPLGTNHVYKVKQSCSFIGATNKLVSEQIIDSTGMRRFYELQCQDKLDWDALAEIDFLKMWQGIDEKKVDGYLLKEIDKVREKQAVLVADDEITLFVQNLGLKADTKDQKPISNSCLYEYYKVWAATNGFTQKPINWFGRGLTGKGFQRKKIRDGEKTLNQYMINSDFLDTDPLSESVKRPIPLILV